MPITIPRDGAVTIQPLTPEQREAAWAYILKTWTDKNPESFRAMLEADEAKRPAGCL